MHTEATHIQQKFDWESIEWDGATPLHTLEEPLTLEPIAAPSASQKVSELPTPWLVAQVLGEPKSHHLKTMHLIAESTPLQDIAEMSFPEFQSRLPHVSHDDYNRFLAAIELGRRVTEAKQTKPHPAIIESTEKACEFCERHFTRLATDGLQEEFHIVTLNTKNHVIATHQITVGTLDASLVHPREVFRPAIRDAAASIIAVHNHPSGDPTPSREGLAVTKRLKEGRSDARHYRA